MNDLLCKIWNVILGLFTKVVEFTAEAIKVVGGATVDVLSELLTSAGSAIGDIFGSNPLLWTIAAGGLLFFLARDKDKDKTITVNPVQGQPIPGPGNGEIYDG